MTLREPGACRRKTIGIRAIVYLRAAGETLFTVSEIRGPFSEERVLS